ncbi:MAG: phosphatase PAP2 family protein [Clostridia bacterium]|nr:phosphatase PAP2 family protein [Clostridia bacterium]
MSKKNVTLTILAVILFSVLAIAIKADYLAGFESWIYSESVEHMSEPLTNVLKIITNIGGPIGILVICLTILLIPKLRNKVGIPVSLAVVSSFTLNFVLKLCFARERPNILRLVSESSFSFPSGHAMVNMALYTILIIYTFKFMDKKKFKIPLITFMTLLIVAIGFTRVYLGVHYAGDILGGWLLGFAVSMVIYMIMKHTTINDD